MEWTDAAIVLGSRPHGETGAILEVMTREHGRHLGIVHGARSRRLRPVLQPGNTVSATWRARLDDQLGYFTVEPDILRTSRFLGSPLALYGIGALAAHLRFLPERDPHAALFAAASILLDHLGDEALAPALFVRFELMLLAELGFGLDLGSCAATGVTADLGYVSPRSGRAVSREASEPYLAQLLTLPAFLLAEGGEPPDAADIAAGFRLTGFFLERHVYGAGGAEPLERTRFVSQAGEEGFGGVSAMVRP